ncbi:toxin-antitoxin system HicB family antitoxin [Weissella diestrammenae]|uniref:Toxin-antitoxin system HicB family antitoxin n=1 Tax=Weissella diestrammenae TaxID=1162633 RepID=A0A7G9T3H0_9LACO|nr:toxin-antitoxin system HicB family antitoxin [Weissella diestrammenae]MCM0582103.1 toxin-antitoxin system HicB family antitoxin [Weissella diestrammenae]QNN74645.1 toxin-antitoxin system HicB family antitoxin [Weissella diestrammenae]
MVDKKYNGLISLRLNANLHAAIVQAAEKEGRSVNNYIATILTRHLESVQPSKSSFEQRQFVGRTVSGSLMTPENGLILVDGIYYRYLIEGNQAVEPKRQYVIIEANGNVLVLRPF